MKTPNKFDLANIPTPLQKISFNDCQFLIKRDDLTGLELSGNKVRKLEYLIYDAKKKGAEYIYTCGGEQSNHSRATALAAISAGIKPKLFLWGKEKKVADGNLFLSKFIDAEYKFLPKKDYWRVNEVMAEERQKYIKKNIYIIPEGGSSITGIWGYINFINELSNQTDIKKIKGILSAAGSGGTSAGLLVGSALKKLDMKIFAANVLYEKKIIEEKILRLANECVEKYRLNVKIDSKNLEILDGYSAEGYKKIEDKKLRVVKNFAKQTGIFLDPAYTAKAFYAYNENFLERKKNSNILFLHTGGFFGILNKKEQYLNI